MAGKSKTEDKGKNRYEFTILKNYPKERRYILKRKLKESFIEKIKDILNLN